MTENTNDVEVIEGLSALVDVDEDAGEPGVYEVGYHLLPTVSENALEEEHKKIAGLFGEVIGERTPSEITLAYAIDKKVDGKRETFEKAYFGWVAAELPASDVSKIKEALDANNSLLRFLITKTSRDQVAATLADPSLDAGAPEPEVEVEEVVGADTEEEPVQAEAASEEEKE